MSALNIQGNLPWNAAGGGMVAAASSPAALGQQYASSYDAALAMNQQNYTNIMQGYGTLNQQVANTLGQGGTPWGVAAPAAQAISDTLTDQMGTTTQGLINAGLGNSTVMNSLQQGNALQAQKAYGSLGSQLAQTYAGYESNLGLSQLNFMNSVNAQYPNPQAYSQLLQQAGYSQIAQQQMQMAQQQMAYNQAMGIMGLSQGQNGPPNVSQANLNPSTAGLAQPQQGYVGNIMSQGTSPYSPLGGLSNAYQGANGTTPTNSPYAGYTNTYSPGSSYYMYSSTAAPYGQDASLSYGLGDLLS
jgi:hypothetical protein